MSGEPTRSTELRNIREALCGVMRGEAADRWLGTPNVAFEGRPPIEVIERGESGRIWRMIHELESGTPT